MEISTAGSGRPARAGDNVTRFASEDNLTLWAGLGSALGAIAVFVVPSAAAPKLLLALAGMGVTASLAGFRGFSPWKWLFAGGLLGLVLLFFLPGANAFGISESDRLARRKKGDQVGVVLSIASVILAVVLGLVVLSL